MNDALECLLAASAVRERCARICELVQQGQGHWFRIDDSRFDQCVELVTTTTLENYPELEVPLHSRWRHFSVAGVDLWEHYSASFAGDPIALTRSAIDLVFLSVILDAGAGAQWRYVDPVSQSTLTRSEGLAAASIDLFFNHVASFDSDDGWRYDSSALENLDESTLSQVFQVNEHNPIVGLRGRLDLIHRLGKVLKDAGAGSITRPGELFDRCLSESENNGNHHVKAEDILQQVLRQFGEIWPNGMVFDGVVLGDCGQHQGIGQGVDAIVPFHKLSQWLTYSLIEPFQWAGVEVIDLDGLTGLPEYRNGGLLMDTGLVRLKNPGLMEQAHSVDSELVVEWRAITVYYLDRIAAAVREKLGLDQQTLPLGAVLQGGTWAAGRVIAHQLRPDDSPPLKLKIDGTVF